MRFPPLPRSIKTILRWAAALALLTSCSSPPPPPAPPLPPVVLPPPPVITAPPVLQDRKISEATNPRDYRKDAAAHLYALNKERLYPGKLPPLLHAIGVLQVQIDRSGNVTGMSWMRAPRHAPDVMAEIERLVRQAAPFPAPLRMGKVIYTDTWLWHISGRFQLDTLTEGQL